MGSTATPPSRWRFLRWALGIGFLAMVCKRFGTELKTLLGVESEPEEIVKAQPPPPATPPHYEPRQDPFKGRAKPADFQWKPRSTAGYGTGYGTGSSSSGTGSHFDFTDPYSRFLNQGSQRQNSDMLYSSSDRVVTVLNPGNFPIAKMAKNDVWLVQFHSSSSSACKDFKSKYVSLGKALGKHDVKVGAVSCDTESALCFAKLGSAYNPRRLPIFATVTSAGLKVMEVEDRGLVATAPPIAALQAHVTANIPAPVANLRLVPQLDEFRLSTVSDPKQASLGIGLILLTSKWETSLLVKSLAQALRGKAAVAEARGSNLALARQLGLGDKPSFPTLVVTCGSAVERYGGDLKHASSGEVARWVKETFGRGKGACQAVKDKSAKRRQNALEKLTLEDLKKMPAEQLKQTALDLGVDVKGKVERVEIVEAIRAKRSV